MDPQIAAQLLGTLIQSAATFLAVYFAIVIFILQDKILAPIFFRYRSLQLTFGLCSAMWIVTIIGCIYDFTQIQLNVQFSSKSITGDVGLFFLTLGLSLLSFMEILYVRITLGKEGKKGT